MGDPKSFTTDDRYYGKVEWVFDHWEGPWYTDIKDANREADRYIHNHSGNRNYLVQLHKKFLNGWRVAVFKRN